MGVSQQTSTGSSTPHEKVRGAKKVEAEGGGVCGNQGVHAWKISADQESVAVRRMA